MAHDLAQGADSLERVIHHGGKVNPLSAKFDFAAADAAYVEQVIYQVDQVADLTLHDVRCRANGLPVHGPYDLHGVADRRQRRIQRSSGALPVAAAIFYSSRATPLRTSSGVKIVGTISAPMNSASSKPRTRKTPSFQLVGRPRWSVVKVA